LLLGLGGAVAALALTASPSQHSRDTHDVLPVFVVAGIGATSYQIMWSSDEGRPEEPSNALAVFTKPSALRDVLPPQLQLMARLMSQSGSEVDSAGARLLVASGTHRVYGVPMKDGSVCIFRETGGGTCPGALLHGSYPQVDAGWKSRRGQVWGLADNGAVSVRVQLDKGWLPAKLGRNGFYLELPPRIVAPKEIVVREQSGISHVFDVKRCRLDTAALPLLSGPLAQPPC
jgi:hypothetical protein